jgi:hypothetical protein
MRQMAWRSSVGRSRKLVGFDLAFAFVMIEVCSYDMMGASVVSWFVSDASLVRGNSVC